MCLPLMVDQHQLGVLVVGVSTRSAAVIERQLLLWKMFAYEASYNLLTQQQHEQLSEDKSLEDREYYQARAREIVHEVNNPIGAIKSSTDVTQRCLDNIQKIIHEMKTSDEILGNRGNKKSVQILQSNVEVTLDASSRIVKIIDSLKNFIHLDETEHQQANINDELENTLTLIQNEISADIKIVKKYGEIPEILCYPGQLNQAFINLLLNAIQALQGKGIVTLKTYVENNSLCINISDTGMGIPPDKLEKIFDLSFIAKDQRIGLVVGLSTVYSIIQKHNGEITVESTLGVGTTFLIEIPLTS